MIPNSLMPLGALVLGTLGSAIGVGPALQLGGLALVLASALVLLVSPQLRGHERVPAPAPAEVESPA